MEQMVVIWVLEAFFNIWLSFGYPHMTYECGFITRSSLDFRWWRSKACRYYVMEDSALFCLYKWMTTGKLIPHVGISFVHDFRRQYRRTSACLRHLLSEGVLISRAVPARLKLEVHRRIAIYNSLINIHRTFSVNLVHSTRSYILYHTS